MLPADGSSSVTPRHWRFNADWSSLGMRSADSRRLGEGGRAQCSRRQISPGSHSLSALHSLQTGGREQSSRDAHEAPLGRRQHTSPLSQSARSSQACS
jgi:hypothetical protein